MSGRNGKAEKRPSKACLLLPRVSALAKPQLPEFSCKIKKKKKKATRGLDGFGCCFSCFSLPCSLRMKKIVFFHRTAQPVPSGMGKYLLARIWVCSFAVLIWGSPTPAGSNNVNHFHAAALERSLHESMTFFPKQAWKSMSSHLFPTWGVLSYCCEFGGAPLKGRRGTKRAEGRHRGFAAPSPEPR